MKASDRRRPHRLLDLVRWSSSTVTKTKHIERRRRSMIVYYFSVENISSSVTFFVLLVYQHNTAEEKRPFSSAIFLPSRKGKKPEYTQYSLPSGICGGSVSLILLPV